MRPQCIAQLDEILEEEKKIIQNYRSFKNKKSKICRSIAALLRSKKIKKDLKKCQTQQVMIVLALGSWKMCH